MTYDWAPMIIEEKLHVLYALCEKGFLIGNSALS